MVDVVSQRENERSRIAMEGHLVAEAILAGAR